MNETKKQQNDKTPASLRESRRSSGPAQSSHHAFPDVKRAEKQKGVDEENELNAKQ